MKLNELLEQISPLPWRFDVGSEEEWASITAANGDTPVLYENVESLKYKECPNPRYIAHAANVLPELVAAVRNLQANWGKNLTEPMARLDDAVRAAEEVL